MSVDPRHYAPVGWTSAGLALMTAALWGGTPVSVKFAGDTLPPVLVQSIRFSLGAVFLLFWCRWEGTELRLRPGQFRPVFISGVLLFLQIGLFGIGIATSNASHGTLLINTFIFWVVALEVFVMKAERLSGQRFFGLILAASGAFIVLTTIPDSSGAAVGAEKHTDEPVLWGDLALVVSSMILGVKIVYTKHVLRTVEPGKLVFWHDVIGVALLFGYSALTEPLGELTAADFTWRALVALGYQGIFVAGLCFAVQAQLLKRHSASAISIFSFATPLFGVVFAATLREDPLSPWLMVSGLCVALGILLVNLRRR